MFEDQRLIKHIAQNIIDIMVDTVTGMRKYGCISNEDFSLLPSIHQEYLTMCLTRSNNVHGNYALKNVLEFYFRIIVIKYQIKDKDMLLELTLLKEGIYSLLQYDNYLYDNILRLFVFILPHKLYDELRKFYNEAYNLSHGIKERMGFLLPDEGYHLDKYPNNIQNQIFILERCISQGEYKNTWEYLNKHNEEKIDNNENNENNGIVPIVKRAMPKIANPIYSDILEIILCKITNIMVEILSGMRLRNCLLSIKDFQGLPTIYNEYLIMSLPKGKNKASDYVYKNVLEITIKIIIQKHHIIDEETLLALMVLKESIYCLIRFDANLFALIYRLQSQ